MYSCAITVAPSDTACTGEIKIRALLNYLQNVAGRAVEDLEGRPGELMRRGYAWVLLRYGLSVVKRLPVMDETFEVTTYHSSGNGLHVLRAFEIDAVHPEGASEKGSETLLRAKTSWVLFDLATQRPVRAERSLPEIFPAGESVFIDPGFREIPDFESAVPVAEAFFPVRFHDLDANIHVNNTAYFEWAYEAAPLDLLAWGVREMAAEFRVSARLGDTVRVEVRELPANSRAGRTREFVYSVTLADGRKRKEEREEKERRPGQEEDDVPRAQPQKPLARLYCVWEQRE